MEKFEVIVIGAGAGGLVAAIGSVKAGRKTLLIEKDNWGGDCTNFGCIPSKALIHAAKIAFSLQEGKNHGIQFQSLEFSADSVLQEVRKLIEKVGARESPKPLKKLGLHIREKTASFLNPYTLSLEKTGEPTELVKGKKIVIATGGSPKIPKISGIENIPFLTNETIFSLKSIPKSLLVIGGGPIGSELAQSFQRLGSYVSIVQRGKQLLKKEPIEASQILQKQMEKEGAIFYLGYVPKKLINLAGNVSVELENQETKETKEKVFEKVLISAGRKPNLIDLKLDNAKIVHTEKGISVDACLRTAQKHIFAIGDVIGEPYFTHLAESHGRCVVFSLIFPFAKRFKEKDVPRVTYTDPEIASIGLAKEEAIQIYGEKKVGCYKVFFSEVDRAVVEKREEGYIELVTKKWSGKILGGVIVGPRAGEMLMEISLAMKENVPLRKIASYIHPYPTYSRAVRKAADQWLTKTILPFFLRKKL